MLYAKFHIIYYCCEFEGDFISFRYRFVYGKPWMILCVKWIKIKYDDVCYAIYIIHVYIIWKWIYLVYMCVCGHNLMITFILFFHGGFVIQWGAKRVSVI